MAMENNKDKILILGDDVSVKNSCILLNIAFKQDECEQIDWFWLRNTRFTLAGAQSLQSCFATSGKNFWTE